MQLTIWQPPYHFVPNFVWISPHKRAQLNQNSIPLTLILMHELKPLFTQWLLSRTCGKKFSSYFKIQFVMIDFL